MKSMILAPPVRSVFSQDGAVLMNIQQGMMYTSNPVGGRILELLSQGLPEGNVVDVISRECEAAQERVRQDVEAFIKQLCSYGLISSEHPELGSKS